MIGILAMHYADDLTSMHEKKRYLGHRHMTEFEFTGEREADQGWNELFTDYLQRREKKVREVKRAGATANVANIFERENEKTVERLIGEKEGPGTEL